jgi:hypothetical protein
MRTRWFLLLLPIAAGSLLAACGPSDAEIAQMTAAAATDTPAPTATPEPTATPTATPEPTATPTATPIPYDLTVLITDEDGAPIPGAQASMDELADAEPLVTGDDGSAAWTDLPGESVTLRAAAQGYFTADPQAVALERGPNDAAIALTRDPYGLLPADACAPGETLLHVEDFQDGLAQGYSGLTEAIEFNAPNGWAIEPDPTAEGNLAASASSIGMSDVEDLRFENAVWRIKVMYTGTPPGGVHDMFLNWYHGWTDAGDWRYPVQMGPYGVFTALTRLHYDSGHFGLSTTSHFLQPDRWYLIEVGTYEGTTALYIDGQKMVEYEDPQPFEWGGIGIEPHVDQGSDMRYFYDDSVVCEISAIFEPKPPAEAEVE